MFNVSTIATAPSWSGWSSSFPIYLTLAYSVIQPVGVVSGLISNLIILIVLVCRQGTLGLWLSVRLYYGAIALGNFFICVRHLMGNFLCVTLALYSSDRVYFCFDSLSKASCIVIQYLYCYSDIVAKYSLVGLTLERFIAVCMPLRAHTLLSSRSTVIILASLILPFALYFTILIPFAVAVVPTVRVTGFLCDRNSELAGTIFSFSTVVVHAALNALLVLVLSLFIFARLRQHSHGRRTLTFIGSSTTLGKPELRKQSQSTISIAVTLTIIALASVTVVNSGTFSLSVVVNTVSWYLPGASKEFHLISHQIYLFIVQCSVISNCVNIFVYFVFIPSFRRATFCLPINGSVKNFINYHIVWFKVFIFTATIKNHFQKSFVGVYKLPCKDCDLSYIVETGKLLKIRMKQHVINCRNHSNPSAVVNHHELN